MTRRGFSDHLIMDNGKATIQVHPDCILRGADADARRTARLRRQRTADALRNFANAFRVENVTADTARTLLNAAFRGRVARDERAVFSWLDGTLVPVDYIDSHNALIEDEFAEIFEEKGLDVDAVLVRPLLPQPTIDSTVAAIKLYNAQALECAKNFLRYECIRTRPVANSMRVAPVE